MAKQKRNCREYCIYSEYCKKYYPLSQGEEGLHFDDCPIAWKLMDMLADMHDDDDDTGKQIVIKEETKF